MNASLLAGARFVGQRLPRKEDLRLLTGKGTFIDDVVLPGMLHAAFARSAIARGRIVAMDTSEASGLPGVRAVFTADDFETLDIALMSGHPVEGMPQSPVPPLANGRVLHVGDPLAIVIADSRAIAEDAAGLITVEYEEDEPVVTIGQARTAPPIFPNLENNIVAAMATPDDAELKQILSSAPHVVSATIRHPRIVHAPMECRGVVASRQGGGELLVHMACQSPKAIASELGGIFRSLESGIRVISKDVGGAFGLKARVWREEASTIAAAMLLNRPVKWAEDRYENLTTANQAREQECTLTAAFDQEGRLLGSFCDYALNNGAYPHFPDNNVAAMIFMWGAYKLPRFGFNAQAFHSNTIGLAAYRGPWAIESLARETLLDIAARQIGIDPIELRRRNLVTAKDQPITLAMGMSLDDVTPSECLDKLLTVIDVEAFRAKQAEARKQGRYLGLGVTAYIEPTASGNFPPMATEAAQVRIGPDGKVAAAMGTHSQGHGTQTTMAQVIADRLGVRFEDVTVFEDDSAGGGYGYGAGGSRQAVAGGGAAIGAAERVLEKVKQLAAHLLNASVESISVQDGMVHVEGSPEMSRSLREIAQIAYGEPGRLPEGMDPGLEAQFRYDVPPVTFASAAHACIVEVDTETGFVEIKRWVCSEDCGVVINPGIVEGQVAGGLAQAIGMVLLEEMVFDANGNPLSVTFKDYLMPQISDVPDFEYTHVVTPSASKGGFRGVGEGGAIIGPPTLVNAIHDALEPFGVDSLDLPLSPSKLVGLIDGGADEATAR
ncbi:MAG: xanthine dehydrogenase family protein molybdopterin-binding subunit [Novosphingobium sp.]|nr:xanthine dehydrogenase family protein molybdopterin-binding subunit [Novosphingobium sp.]